MKKKYFFFDIDGTLMIRKLDQHSIPESTKIALAKLKEAGHFIAIATGRGHFLAKGVMEELGIKHMVSDGGHGLTINGCLQGIKPLNQNYCLDLISECEEKAIGWSVLVDNSNVRLAPNERFSNRVQDEYMKTKVVKGLEPNKYAAIYKMFIACDDGEESELKSLKKLPWCRFHPDYIFVEPSDKSKGIKEIMDYFEAPYEEVVVFGDEKNDLTMFQDDWLKIAMGNAVEVLKEKADYVTDDVDQDGIYKACQHFGWIK